MKLLDNFVVRVIVFILLFEAAFIGVNYVLDVLVFHQEFVLFRPASVALAAIAGIVMAVQYKSEKPEGSDNSEK